MEGDHSTIHVLLTSTLLPGNTAVATGGLDVLRPKNGGFTFDQVEL